MLITPQALSGYGAPTKNTVGNIGDIYTDLNTGTKYKCIIVFSYTGHDSLTVEHVWKEQMKEQTNSGSSSGIIKKLQMAKVVGLTSEILIEHTT